MIDWLIQIPGPVFLVYYTGLSIGCIVIGWLLANAGEPSHARSWIIFLLTAGVLLGAGGTKLCLGLTRGRPVLFLVFLLIISLTVLYAALKPTFPDPSVEDDWRNVGEKDEDYGRDFRG